MKLIQNASRIVNSYSDVIFDESAIFKDKMKVTSSPNFPKGESKVPAQRILLQYFEADELCRVREMQSLRQAADQGAWNSPENLIR